MANSPHIALPGWGLWGQNILRELLTHGEADFIEITRNSEKGPQSSRMPISSEPPLRRELRACLDHLRGGPPSRTSAFRAGLCRDCACS